MQLDQTTLTRAQFDGLIEALLTLDTLKSSTGRDDVVSGIVSGWANDIGRRDTPRGHVRAIWTTASSHDGLPELLAAIRVIEQESPAFLALSDRLEELAAFVEANAELYPRLGAFVGALGNPPNDAVAWWLRKVCSVVGEVAFDPRDPFRDLLLTLGEYRADPDGDSFPLFVVLDGIAGDVLDPAALAPFRTTLDGLAVARKVTLPGIARLRASVDGARARVIAGGAPGVMSIGDPSILVVIEPDKELTTPPHYSVRVYDWLPWETAAMALEMGSRGRAQNPSDAKPPRTREALLSEGGRAELGDEVGQRLRTRPMEKPLVEFLLPAALICDDFETVEIDVLGLGGASQYEPLGTWARVVVRPLDRWESRFRQNAGLLTFWATRWRGFTSHLAGPLRSWWWKDGQSLGRLRAEHSEVGCLGLGFAPATPELAKRVYFALLAVGAPVALWTRVPIEGDIEGLLRNVVDATQPQDLRDRVQSERAKAHEDTQTPHVGRSLTLFWDDPDRPPKPVT